MAAFPDAVVATTATGMGGLCLGFASYRELHRASVGIEVPAPFLTSLLHVLLFSGPQPSGEGTVSRR